MLLIDCLLCFLLQMGLLSLGTPLDWEKSREHNEHVRLHGISQLINMFRQHGLRRNDSFLWGDEIEYMIVDFDDTNKTAKLAINYDHVISDLNDEEKSLHKSVENNVSFHPEYGRYMIEGTPLKPYNGNLLEDYAYVETNMATRRLLGNNELPPNMHLVTLTSFARLGCPEFTSPESKPVGPALQSLFLPDEIINRHVRFPTLTANIRKRRGRKVAINLPLYPDVNTKLVDDLIPLDRKLYPSDKEAALGAAKPGHVYLDSMGFGMGSSCLQVTMQAADVNEARYLYDALAPFTPVLLAVSAAAPIFRGHLVNQDIRWNVVSGAVDDRTFLEKKEEPYHGYSETGGLDLEEKVPSTLEIDESGNYVGVNTADGKNVQYVPKSRYDSIDAYLGDSGYETGYFKKSYNDLFVPINDGIYDRLLKSGHFDNELARHFAHLFIRDPLVIFSERLDSNDDLDNDHFENIQSTNWQTLRFKPPALYPAGTDLSSKPGWRVEFRPLEIQLTDFENAAFSNVIALLSKAIIAFRPDFYIPITKIEQNMTTAHRVDAATNEKFWFKCFGNWRTTDLKKYSLQWLSDYIDGTLKPESNGVLHLAENGFSNVTEAALYSADAIVNGDSGHGGMIHLIIKLLATDLIPNFEGSREDLIAYLTRIKFQLQLVSRRASGAIPTTAHWLREKVLSSPLYHQDSRVSQELNYFLTTGALKVSELSDKVLLAELVGEDIADYLCR